MKILIVDDNKLQLEAISHNLKSNGYDTVTAENGYEALDLIAKLKIDLIISDVMMPTISGLGLLSLLKKFYYSRIPVILISASHDAEILLHGIGLGAVDFISKPIDFKGLLKRVKKHCK